LEDHIRISFWTSIGGKPTSGVCCFWKKYQRYSLADPNGAFISGSNMEFISVPLSKLRSKPTSSYDTKELNIEMKALAFILVSAAAC
jgi:hypothetical protein